MAPRTFLFDIGKPIVNPCKSIWIVFPAFLEISPTHKVDFWLIFFFFRPHVVHTYSNIYLPTLVVCTYVCLGKVCVCRYDM